MFQHGYILACEQALRSALAAGREKEGELATTTSGWRKTESPVDGEPQGNWGWNSNSREVVASSMSSPAAKGSRRACSRANKFRLDFRHPRGPPRSAGSFSKQRLLIKSQTYFLPVHPSTTQQEGILHAHA